MQRVKVTVEYDDGTTDEVVLRPVALVATERHFKGNPPPVEGTLYAMHYQLRIAESFGDWMDRIAAIEEEAVDPTKAAASAPSPTSQ